MMTMRLWRPASIAILVAVHAALFVYVLGYSIAAGDAHRALPTSFGFLSVVFALPLVWVVSLVLSPILIAFPSADRLVLVGSEAAVAIAWAYFIRWLVSRSLPNNPLEPTPKDGAAQRPR